MKIVEGARRETVLTSGLVLVAIIIGGTVPTSNGQTSAPSMDQIAQARVKAEAAVEELKEKLAAARAAAQARMAAREGGQPTTASPSLDAGLLPAPGGSGGGGADTASPVPAGQGTFPLSYPTNAILKWQMTLDYCSFQIPAVAPDGTAYFYNGLHFWAVTNGGVMWKNDFFPCGTYGGAVIGPDGTVYIANANGDIVGLNPADGTTNWTCSGYGTFNAMAMSPDGGALYAVGRTQVSCISVTNGTPRWVYSSTTNAFSQTAPAVASDGTIYLNTQSPGSIVALDPDGSFKWKADLSSVIPSTGDAASPAVGSGGTIYFCAEGIFALNPDGHVKWYYNETNSYGSQTGYGCLSPEIAADGTVYAILNFDYCPTSALYAVTSNGSVKWSRPLDNGAGSPHHFLYRASTCAIGGDGQIFVADSDGTVYSFGPDGSTNWTYQTHAGMLLPPVFGPEGNLYIMSVDTSQMFCFAARTLIGCTPWPEFRKNSRNTGAAVPQSGGGHFHDMAMSTNGFSLLVSAPTNTIDCICATRDFVTWTNLGELVLTNSTTNFLDTGATNYRYRFYRAYPQ